MLKSKAVTAAPDSALMPGGREIESLEARYGIQIAGHYNPSEQIGGDFWDVRPLDDTRFGICLADFSGHGLRAALQRLRLHAMLGEGGAVEADPSRMLEWLGKRLHASLPTGQFATMLYAVVDARAQSMTIANAGALPPVLITPDGAVSNPWVGGLPLGSAPRAAYKSVTMPFAPGGLLLLMSDGLAECPGTGDDALYYNALRDLAQRASAEDTPAPQLLRRIVEACLAYPGRLQSGDDETAVLITCQPI